MRVTLLISALALASAASAQRPVDTREAAVWDAYQNFRSNDLMKFEVTGSDTHGRISTPVHIVMYYWLSTDLRTGHKSKAAVDLAVYSVTPTGDLLSMRIVGDGTNLYRYDFSRREVTSDTYGYYGNSEPANYVGSDAPKMFSQLRALTPGVAAYAVRLLSEVNPAGAYFAPRYADWMPGRARQFFDEVPVPMRQVRSVVQAETVTDPITGRVFLRGDDEYVFYGMDRVNTDRTVSFHMYDVNGNAGNGSEMWEVQTMNIGLRTSTRILDLEVVPTILNPLASGVPTGTFVPYIGAQGAMFRPVTRGQ